MISSGHKINTIITFVFVLVKKLVYFDEHLRSRISSASSFDGIFVSKIVSGFEERKNCGVNG
jgi:hypothetical protein